MPVEFSPEYSLSKSRRQAADLEATPGSAPVACTFIAAQRSELRERWGCDRVSSTKLSPALNGD